MRRHPSASLHMCMCVNTSCLYKLGPETQLRPPAVPTMDGYSERLMQALAFLGDLSLSAS